MLEERLKKHIEAYGAITARSYQDVVLYDPVLGYYAQSKVIGRDGDFITSPEVSQVFGEILALSCVDHWIQMGRPEYVIVTELGPGRGTLMADMIRVFKQFSDFWRAVDIYLVEICPTLLKQQTDLLGKDVTHVSSLALVPESDIQFIIANEFFDALPVEQYVYDPATNSRTDRLISFNDDSWYFMPHASHECIIEESAASMVILDEIKRRLNHGAGMALIIDYGDCVKGLRSGDTLQAIYQHRRVSVFDCIGKADLSHHVDFNAFQNVLFPLSCQVLTQGEFLIQQGINERTEFLAHRNPAMAADLRMATARLTAPSVMGNLFKVLVVTH